MQHIQLLSNDYLRIEYNMMDDILIGHWTGPLTDEMIREGYDQLLALLKKNFCHKLLDNHLEVQGIWADLSGWVAHDWHPRAENLGLQFHACVFARDGFSRMSTEKMIDMVQKGIVQGFDTMTAAENWLRAF